MFGLNGQQNQTHPKGPSPLVGQILPCRVLALSSFPKRRPPGPRVGALAQGSQPQPTPAPRGHLETFLIVTWGAAVIEWGEVRGVAVIPQRTGQPHDVGQGEDPAPTAVELTLKPQVHCPLGAVAWPLTWSQRGRTLGLGQVLAGLCLTLLSADGHGRGALQHPARGRRAGA